MSKGMTVIAKTVARLTFPFLFLFGIYVILHGHLTPGGGFPGGVIIAASIVMLILTYGEDSAKDTVNRFQAEVSESLGTLILVFIGIMGILLSTHFLSNEILPMGELGDLLSAGNLPLLNIGVGVKVAAGFVTVMYAMLGLKGD